MISRAPEMRFRPMVPADLDRVMVINRQSFRNPWSADLMRREAIHPWSTVLLAVEDGPAAERVLGFIVFWTVHDEVHVLNVAVAEEERRRGVAWALMEQAAERGRAKGGRLVTLEVRSTNVGAITLYRRLGYRDVGLRRNYYAEEGEDAIVMEKALV